MGSQSHLTGSHYKLSKICFFYLFVDEIKTAEFGMFAPTSPFYNTFAIGLSILKNLRLFKALLTYAFTEI